MNFCPKLNILYYKNILECAIKDYFQSHNSDFTRNSDGYVNSRVISRTRLKKEFKTLIANRIKEFMKPFDMMNPNYYFIVGSCLPKDNIMLSYVKEGQYFPEKLKKYISENPNIKYLLIENDIKIDNEMFNSIFEELFNELFDDRMKKKLFPEYTNLNFIKHTKLGCYMLWRIFRNLYGKTSVVNMFREKNEMMEKNMTSLNDEIEKYFNNKKEMTRSSDFGIMVQEIRKRVEECLVR